MESKTEALLFTWGAKRFMHHACPMWCQTHRSSNMKFHIHIVPTSSNFEDVSHPKVVDVSTPHLNTHRHLWEGLDSCYLLFSPLPLVTYLLHIFSNSHVYKGTSKDWTRASITDSVQGFHKRVITPRGSITRV